ncbi:MAG: IgGFc-binding protein [Chlorobi bacterium]|nr:IgGFc-binding protein [Chlorobiota bacterium]
MTVHMSNRWRFAIVMAVMIAAALVFRPAHAQPVLDQNGAGTTYVLAFPDTTTNTLDSRFPNPPAKDGFSIFMYSATGPNKVKVISNGAIDSVTLAGGKFLAYDVRTSPVVTIANAVQYNTIRLEAEQPIIVYCYFVTAQSCEAWTPIPVEMWGKEYDVAATPGSYVNDIYTPPGLDATNRQPKPAPAEFLIIAASDSTHVTINNHGRQLDGNPPLRITLDAHQCYQAQSYVNSEDFMGAQPDIAGTRITADKPIGVISGNSRTSPFPGEGTITDNSYKNMLMEWIPPTEGLGTEFVYMPTWDGHRPGINAPAERAGEYVRLYGVADGLTLGRIIYAGMSNNSYTIQKDTLKEFFISEAQAAYFKTQSRVMVMMHSYGIAKYQSATPCDGSLLCRVYATWAPYMVELTPREQWTTFAPYYAPVNPAGMLHYINVVCDTGDQKNFYTEAGKPFPFSRAIPGTGLVWGSQAVAQGKDHYLIGRNGARFAGYVYGLLEGREESRPGAGREGEYEESNALSYGYPLASEHRVTLPPDELRIDTSFDCPRFHVKITALNANPVGLRSVELDPATTFNARLVPISPASLKDVNRLGLAVMDIEPVDPLQDAGGTLIIRDRTGALKSVPYVYHAERLHADHDSLDFGEVITGQPRTAEITYTNQESGDIMVSDIRLASGTKGFSVISTIPPAPATLKRGETLRVTVRINPATPNVLYTDSIRITLDCIALLVPLRAETVEPLIMIGDLDFGVMRQGDPVRSRHAEICNIGRGRISFLPDTAPGASPDVLTWLDGSFDIPRSTIDSLRTIHLGPNECFGFPVFFNPVRAGVHRTVARVWGSTRNIRDTARWNAVVEPPLGTDRGVGAESAGFQLEEARPNPFGGRTEIGYRLGAAGHVVVEIYDIVGRRVGLLADDDQEAGEHRVIWDAAGLPCGLYYCRVHCGRWSAMRPLVMEK